MAHVYIRNPQVHLPHQVIISQEQLFIINFNSPNLEIDLNLQLDINLDLYWLQLDLVNFVLVCVVVFVCMCVKVLMQPPLTVFIV